MNYRQPSRNGDGSIIIWIDKIKMPGEVYLSHLKIHVSGFETSPFGVEWMRFDDDCAISELIKTIPHIAFEVKNIEEEIRKHHLEVISEPGTPSEGVRAAMIAYDGGSN